MGQSTIGVTPGSGRNVVTYQDASSNDHPVGVIEILVGTTPTQVSTSAPVPVGGNVASGAADAGNPVKVAGVYNSSPPTFTTGQRGDLQLDAAGRLIVNVGAGGSSGGTSSSFGSAFPATG